MSKFIVYDDTRTPIGEIEGYESIQWLENYQSAGEVKIVTPRSDAALELIREGYRVYNTDSDTVAKIVHRDMAKASDGKETLTFRGVLTAQLLDDRIIMDTVTITDAETGMYKAYADNRRELPIEVGTSESFGIKIPKTEITWDSVLSAETEIGEASGLGFKVIFDPDTKEETFKVYKGTDRSDITSDDYVGAFSPAFDSLNEVQLTEGSEDYKNVAIVAGEERETGRVTLEVSLNAGTGEDRRELYVDARDIQSEKDGATMTDAEYNELLRRRGLKKLLEHLRTFDLDCTAGQVNMIFGRDYFLGDRMPVQIWDIEGSVLVSSVNRIYENGASVVISLTDFQIKE